MLITVRLGLLTAALAGVGLAHAATDWSKPYADDVISAGAAQEFAKTVKVLSKAAPDAAQQQARMAIWNELNPQTPQSAVELAAQWVRYLDNASKNQPYYANVVKDNFVEYVGCIFANPLMPHERTIFNVGGIGSDLIPVLVLYGKTPEAVNAGYPGRAQSVADTFEIWKSEKDVPKYTKEKSYQPYHPLLVAEDLFGDRTNVCSAAAMGAASDFRRAKAFYADPIVKVKKRQYQPAVMPVNWKPEIMARFRGLLRPKGDFTAAIIMRSGAKKLGE